jgi:hypothetical protein
MQTVQLWDGGKLTFRLNRLGAVSQFHSQKGAVAVGRDGFLNSGKLRLETGRRHYESVECGGIVHLVSNRVVDRYVQHHFDCAPCDGYFLQ